MSIPIIPLEKGQTIYRYLTTGVFRYKVIGIRDYESHTLYEVECLSCTQGYQCRCLVAVNSENAIQHVDFINNDDEDSQHHWHNGGEPYFRTLEETNRYIGRRLLSGVNEEIDRLEKGLKDARVRKTKYAALVETGTQG